MTKSCDSGLGIIISIILCSFVILLYLLLFVEHDHCPVLFNNNTVSKINSSYIQKPHTNRVKIDCKAREFTKNSNFIPIYAKMRLFIPKWNFIRFLYMVRRSPKACLFKKGPKVTGNKLILVDMYP